MGDRHTAVRDRQKDQRVSDGDRHRQHLERSDATEKQASWGEAPHLGEAGSSAPGGVAGVCEHPLGGLIVLGELQGGSRLMTKRPQAAMLRFIWEALRKS